MEEPKFSTTTTTQLNDHHRYSSSSTTSSVAVAPPPPPTPKTISLMQPSQKRKHKPRVFCVFRSIFRSFPIITSVCKLSVLLMGLLDSNRMLSGTRITGTLFRCKKARVSLSIQETPRCLLTFVVELAMQTNVLQKELSLGMVRIALKCDKWLGKEKTKLMDEPLWTMYCNGKKMGYDVKREATEEDLNVMELLKAVSMGAGVLPGSSDTNGLDGEWLI